MSTHTSAIAPEETLHETETTTVTVSDPTKRAALSPVINNTSIDPQWRTIIRCALELDDPWLAELIHRAEADENIIDTFESLRTPNTDEDDSTAGKIEALTKIICRGGDEPTAALYVLMGTLEDCTRPQELAQRAKHLAFTRCAELNLYGMADTHLAGIEELLASNPFVT
jgi:hypothetical protein